MGKRYHLLSEEALAALLVSHLPVEQMPEPLETRVQQRVLALVHELKHTKPTRTSGLHMEEGWEARRQVLQRH